jgi:hypothetical protein
LDEAESWSQARRRLYELHLLAFNDVAILPLWQLPVITRVAVHFAA